MTFTDEDLKPRKPVTITWVVVYPSEADVVAGRRSWHSSRVHNRGTRKEVEAWLARRLSPSVLLNARVIEVELDPRSAYLREVLT